MGVASSVFLLAFSTLEALVAVFISVSRDYPGLLTSKPIYPALTDVRSSRVSGRGGGLALGAPGLCVVCRGLVGWLSCFVYSAAGVELDPRCRGSGR